MGRRHCMSMPTSRSVGDWSGAIETLLSGRKEQKTRTLLHQVGAAFLREKSLSKSMVRIDGTPVITAGIGSFRWWQFDARRERTTLHSFRKGM